MAMDSLLSDTLTTREIARIVGRTEETIRVWIRERRLPAIRLMGREYRVRRNDLNAMIEGSPGPKGGAR